jgi:hypothetical protein
MKAYGGVDVYFHVFLTSTLVGGEWSVPRPCRFTPGERALGTHWTGGWVEPRAGLDATEKRKFLTLLGLELRPLVVQPVAIPTTLYNIICIIMMMIVSAIGFLQDATRVARVGDLFITDQPSLRVVGERREIPRERTTQVLRQGNQQPQLCGTRPLVTLNQLVTKLLYITRSW